MLKKGFNWLAVLVLTMAILVGIGVVIAPKFGWHLDIVYGASMEPAIDTGSLAVIRPVNPQTVSEGDIITYSRSADTSKVVTHRVVEVIDGENGLVFRTKGDANEEPDASVVAAENVVGTVWTSIPYLGYVMDFIRKPLGFILLIGIPAALIVLMELWSIFTVVRDRRQGSSLVSNE